MWRCQLCGAENGLERFVFEPQASFELFPFYDLHNWAPVRAAALRRLFWHTFFGEAKKVCSCRSTTGQQSHNNHRSKNKNTSKPSAHIPCASQANILNEAHEYA
jgi:hypothetical protein